VFGLLMYAAGLYYLITGIRSLGQGEPERRPRKRKRRRIEAYDD
jgi:hypothetical protein